MEASRRLSRKKKTVSCQFCLSILELTINLRAQISQTHATASLNVPMPRLRCLFMFNYLSPHSKGLSFGNRDGALMLGTAYPPFKNDHTVCNNMLLAEMFQELSLGADSSVMIVFFSSSGVCLRS
jgi:hypothetical protein